MIAAGLVIAGSYCLLATPQYQSTARVFISTDATDASQAYLGSAFGTARVQSYADLAGSRELMQKVIKKLNLNLSPAELKSKISASVVTGTVIITINAKDSSPRIAQQIAQAEAEELTGYLTDLETPVGKNASPVKATITDPADYQPNAVAPRTALYLLIAGILGLLLGIGLAVLRDLLDTTVKSPDDLAAIKDSPVMTHVVFDAAVATTPLLADAGTHSDRSEAFRLLRTNLQFLDLDANPKSFVITSAIPGEGKTSTAANLAIVLSQAGKRVLLVDGDLRRPRIAKLLSLESSVGLTTVLVGRSALQDSIQRHEASGVFVLSSGPVPPNPTEILQARATRDLLLNLREMFDVVIIDAPPLLPVADAAIMATDADGAILVVQHGKTTKEQVRMATTRLEQVSAKLYGYVVNMTPRGRNRNDAYGYGYGYYGDSV